MGSSPVTQTAATAVPPETRSAARRVLLDAIVLGGLGDALLRQGPGLGLFIWMLAFAATFAHFVTRRADPFTREQRAWLGTALFFAAAFAWRDGASLLFYDFLAMLVALGLLGATSSYASPMRSILGQRVRDVAQAAGRAVQTGAIGIVHLLHASAATDRSQSWRHRRASSIVRASLLALPLLLVFGALFSSADPVFGKLITPPRIDLGEVASHLVVSGVVAWIVGGWLYRALIDERRGRAVREGMPITLGSLDLTIVLGGLVALFALFVSVQIGWLFGGERLVRSTTGLSYAQYARHGFFELVMVALLVLPVLLGTRAAIRDEDTGAIRRHRLLSIPLLLLLGGVMGSALGRMALYVHYYGLSVDRLFATVFMGWLALVFSWFGLTVLRGRTRDFAAGMMITGFVTLAAVNLANPESFVARVNIARAGTALQVADSTSTNARVEAPIDFKYLTYQLNGDAADQVVGALLAQPVSPAGSANRMAEVKARCEGVRGLLRRWGSGLVDGEDWRGRGVGDWRLWNVGAWRASLGVRSNERALRAVTCLDASGEAPFGDRDGRPARPGEQWYGESRSDAH